MTIEPIPMILHCPGIINSGKAMCGARHIDEGEFATKVHHTHSCQICGHTWRPAVVPTVGVQFLPGFKSEPSDRQGSTEGVSALACARFIGAQRAAELKTGPTPPCTPVGQDAPAAPFQRDVLWKKDELVELDGLESILRNLRGLGWLVAAHNDYRLNGESFTYWLLRKGDQAVQGEARTDIEALRLALIEVARIQREELLTLRRVKLSYYASGFRFGNGARAVALANDGVRTNAWSVYDQHNRPIYHPDGSLIWDEREAIEEVERLGSLK